MGNDWEIQGNKERAKDLLNFLNSCDVKKITPISPISIQGVQLNLINIEAYSNWTDSTRYNLPKNWVSRDGFFKRSLNQGEIEVGIISLLKELDSARLALPNLPSLTEVPAVIEKRVREIGLGSQTKKLSEILKEKTELLFSEVLHEDTYNGDIPLYTSCCVEASKDFERKSREWIYRGTYDFFMKKEGDKGPLIRGIEITIPRGFIVDKSTLDSCPVRPVRTDTFIREDKLYAPKDLFFCDKDTGTRYQLKVGNQEMVLKIEEGIVCSSITGIKYSPVATSKLEKMEALADWIVANNVEGKK